jgi:hypothetical protein
VEYMGVGGAEPVNKTMFKLELKIYRVCSFYTSARPGWLTRVRVDANYLYGGQCQCHLRSCYWPKNRSAIACSFFL